MPVSRKILIRVIGAPLLVAALCALLYWGHGFERRGERNLPLYGLVLLVGVVCALELRGMCAARGIALTPGLPAFVAMTVVAWYLHGRTHPPLATFGLIATLLFLYLACLVVFRFGRFSPEAAGLTMFAYIYVCLLGFLLFPPVPPDQSSLYLLFLLAAGKGSDMAAFVAGKSFGRHKMAPVVSPNKTWEGGIAGGVVGTAAGFAVLWWSPLRQIYAPVPVGGLLLFCLIVTIAGQVGDLVKSAFKRWAGVKDSGRILPEFGGMIDMVDSFLLEAPIACLGTVFLVSQFKGS
jgi:phosphatidate cytidylyltransferase